MARPRDQNKDIERVVADAEAHGWIFDTKRKGYWLGRCGCGRHLKTVKSTPSNPNYAKNLHAWFRRTCGWPREKS